jgi:hypothetical protein
MSGKSDKPDILFWDFKRRTYDPEVAVSIAHSQNHRKMGSMWTERRY